MTQVQAGSESMDLMKNAPREKHTTFSSIRFMAFNQQVRIEGGGKANR